MQAAGDHVGGFLRQDRVAGTSNEGCRTLGGDGQPSREGTDEPLSAGGTSARTPEQQREQEDVPQLHVVVALVLLYGASVDFDMDRGGQAQAGQGLARAG